ncbi:MAG: ion channel [bacterium]|jgi:voltage-gated potassium channel
MPKHLDSRTRHNLVLLALSVIFIFVIGLFTQLADMSEVYFTFMSLIIVVSVFTIRRKGAAWLYLPIALVILTWIAELLKLSALSTISGVLAMAFFFIVVVMLVIRVASSREVGLREFLESINVYLLLGIAASILFFIVYRLDPDAYNYPGESPSGRFDFIYYSFVTMTTLGYGDITPISPVARMLSIFFSVAGQLYLTMIIALLVGKYLSQRNDE